LYVKKVVELLNEFNDKIVEVKKNDEKREKKMEGCLKDIDKDIENQEKILKDLNETIEMLNNKEKIMDIEKLVSKESKKEAKGEIGHLNSDVTNININEEVDIVNNEEDKSEEADDNYDKESNKEEKQKDKQIIECEKLIDSSNSE